MVEQAAVNRWAVGSSPTLGGNISLQMSLVITLQYGNDRITNILAVDLLIHLQMLYVITS